MSMSELTNWATNTIAEWTDEQRREICSRLVPPGASDSPVKKALFAWLNGQDANDRERMSAIFKSWYEHCVTEIPFLPNRWGKDKLREPAYKAFDNIVIDVCSW